MDVKLTTMIKITDTSHDTEDKAVYGINQSIRAALGDQGTVTMGKLALPASGDVQNLCLGSVVRVHGVFVSLGGKAKIKIDSGVPMDIVPPEGSDKATFFLTGPLQSASVSSTAGQDIDALYVLWGEAQA